MQGTVNTVKVARILIVDDNSKNIKVLGEILSREGYELGIAANGEQALRFVQTIAPDLILMDVMMPEMDGYEACRRLKESTKNKDIPIIFLTAKTETGDLVKGFELGAVDYVSKPFNHTELLARVKTHLELYSSRMQLKQLNQELQTTQAQMIHSAKLASLGQLAAGVAHEINNPIQVIELAAALLKEQILGREEVDVSYLDRIISMSKRCGVVTRHLLEFGRGKREALVKDLDVNELVQKTMLLLHNQLQTEDIELELDLMDSLPLLTTIPISIEHTLIQLLNNSKDALKNRAVKKICIRTYSKEDRVFIEVEDSGSGIPEAFMERLFDPFFTTKEVGTGTGTGLSVCHGLIRNIGGQINVRSEEGKGATFIVEIPIVNAPVTIAN
ncbi:response regulator [Deltaproteobacteria bacterium TL4]